jgi:glutamate-1-semialdehyde aminotransferase
MSSPRYKISNELFREAEEIIPGGAPQSRHPNTFLPGYFPLYFVRGKGSKLWDVDGHSYIDWLLSYGPIVIGHANDRIDNAVIERIREGFCFDLNSEINNRLAKKIISAIPCAEMVRFLKTGSCATAAAVRIARLATEKYKILRCGFHGWHDWSIGGKGVPPGATEDVHAFSYNDIDSLEKLIKKYRGKVAAVIMMPVEVIPPQKGFLEDVRKITAENEIVLIFDEVRSGFRLAHGGAQEYYKVIPDMATFSKAMANGYAISCVVGKRNVMQAASKSFISATFFPNAMEMVASYETLSILEEENAVAHFFRIGNAFQKGLQSIVDKLDFNQDVKVTGLPVMPYLEFVSGNEERKTRLKNRFYAEALAKGIFLHPNHHWFTCLSHTEDDVNETLNVCADAMKTAKDKMNVDDDISRIKIANKWW